MGGEWVTIAVLAKPRGNQGELLAFSLSDSPGRFEQLKRVFLFREETNLGERAIDRVWWHGERLVVKFTGVDSIDAAAGFSGLELRVPIAERAPLDAGMHYQSDLIGCELRDANGTHLGAVTGWEEYGGPGLMEVDGNWLLPFTPSICKNVDVAARRIVVDLPEGLRELNER